MQRRSVSLALLVAHALKRVLARPHGAGVKSSGHNAVGAPAACDHAAWRSEGDGGLSMCKLASTDFMPPCQAPYTWCRPREPSQMMVLTVWAITRLLRLLQTVPFGLLACHPCQHPFPMAGRTGAPSQHQTHTTCLFGTCCTWHALLAGSLTSSPRMVCGVGIPGSPRSSLGELLQSPSATLPSH